MGVASVVGAHLVHRLGEQAFAVEDVRVFGKETEHQPCHEVIHVATSFFPGPIRVLTQQFDVELVQTPCGSNVDGVVLDLLDRGDARQRQQEPEMVREILKIACDGLTADQLFGFQRLSISGQDELGFGLGGGRAVSQSA